MEGWEGGEVAEISPFFQVARATWEEVNGDGCYRGEDGLRKNARREQGRKVEERKFMNGRGESTHLIFTRVPCAN